MKMKNIFKSSFFVMVAMLVISCNKDDSSNSSIELRNRQDVYDENIAEIEAYLKATYLTVDADLDATVDSIDAGQVSIWDQLDYPLQSVTVKNDARTTNFTDGRFPDDVDYKLYYIVLNEGGGEFPKSVDSTLVGYKGWNLENKIFDQNDQGVWFTFPQLGQFDPVSISGFRQILSKVRTSPNAPTLESDGTLTWSDYGNVLVFIPSGLAYFSSPRAGIGAYKPIAFQTKLYKLKKNDHDRDRVLSVYEDLNNDNDYFNDDTDGDRIPDFLDIDDDGDGFVTKTEIKKPEGEAGLLKYYPFNIVLDDPTTPEDETELKGIPSCSNDFTTPARLRKHLDRNCH